jgi:mono/diheme cytochrome c family protein
MRVSLLFLGSGALFFAGCGFDTRAADLRFTLQPSTALALQAQPELAAQLENGLAARFGTPAEPRGPALGELDAARLARVRRSNAAQFSAQLEALARGDFDAARAPRAHPALQARYDALVRENTPDTRERASALFADFYPTLAESAELYRVECLHCHGTSGGGDGPTANTIDPKPRDFRRGIFKWTSVRDQGRPTRDDLVRVLERGVWGTSMPSFRRLSDTELDGLADYVRFLSVRGEVERALVVTAEDDGELTDASWDDALALVTAKWERAPELVVTWDGAVPEPTPEAIALGAQLYGDAKKGNCAACHGADGRGDGPVAYKLDDRGRRVPAYQDAWGFDILPRNLVRDPWRGGNRPIDLYRRIHSGIAGGPMPALSNVLSGDEIWALVHYTRTLAEHPDGDAARRE